MPTELLDTNMLGEVLDDVQRIERETGRRWCIAKFGALECRTPEDHGSDGDEARLSINIDGIAGTNLERREIPGAVGWLTQQAAGLSGLDSVPVPTRKQQMRAGTAMPLDLVVPYTRYVAFKLHDDDDPGFPLYDDHDLLGEPGVRPPSGDKAEGVLRFTEDGADYSLWYQTVRVTSFVETLLGAVEDANDGDGGPVTTDDVIKKLPGSGSGGGGGSGDEDSDDDLIGAVIDALP